MLCVAVVQASCTVEKQRHSDKERCAYFIPYHADCVTGGTPAANKRIKRVLSVKTRVINVLSCISRQMILYSLVSQAHS